VVASEHDILDGIALRLRAGWLAALFAAAPALTEPHPHSPPLSGWLCTR